MTSWQLVRLFAGTFILVSLALGVPGSPVFVSTWWLAFTAFVGANLLQASFTGFCPAAITSPGFNSAARTATPWRSPGEVPIRSTGPLTLIAATTRPSRRESFTRPRRERASSGSHRCTPRPYAARHR